MGVALFVTLVIEMSYLENIAAQIAESVPLGNEMLLTILY